MLILGLICLMVFNMADSAYSSSSNRNGHRYGSSYAPSYGYGNGAYAGAGGYAGAGSFAGGFDPFTFVFGHQNDETYSDTYAHSTDDAFAKAEASFSPDDNHSLLDPYQIHANNLAFQDQLTKQILAQNAYYANRAGGHRRRGPGYATYAGGSVSVGPNGVHHVTFVHPPNSHSPNIDTRGGGHRGAGFGGVASSSYSTNVNGKHHGGSATLINDNGKVYSYRTHS